MRAFANVLYKLCHPTISAYELSAGVQISHVAKESTNSLCHHTFLGIRNITPSCQRIVAHTSLESNSMKVFSASFSCSIFLFKAETIFLHNYSLLYSSVSNIPFVAATASVLVACVFICWLQLSETWVRNCPRQPEPWRIDMESVSARHRPSTSIVSTWRSTHSLSPSNPTNLEMPSPPAMT